MKLAINFICRSVMNISRIGVQMEKTKAMCRGCTDDFYNHRSNSEGCWHFKTAKIVTRYRIGTWTLPGSPGAFTEVKVLSCRSEQGEHFYERLPDFVKMEDVIRK
jgi:hypothetical protein